MKKETAASEEWKLLYVHVKHHKLLVAYDSMDLLLIPSHPVQGVVFPLLLWKPILSLRRIQAGITCLSCSRLGPYAMIKARNCWYHHFPPLPVFHLEFYTWFPNTPLSRSVILRLVLYTGISSWKSKLIFPEFVLVLYAETWESGCCQRLDKCHFSGPLNHFPFLISQSFLATEAAGSDT